MTPEFKEAAKAYVEETDYIDDLNRNLTGNAFIAGAEYGSSSMASYVDELEADNDKLRTRLKETENVLAELTCSGPNHSDAIAMAHAYYRKYSQGSADGEEKS